MTNEALAVLIRQVAAAVEVGGTVSILDDVAPLRKYVTPHCHEGMGDYMDASDSGHRMKLEWYAGQLLAIVDEKEWFAVNSWLNCVDKFTVKDAA